MTSKHSTYCHTDDETDISHSRAPSELEKQVGHDQIAELDWDGPEDPDNPLNWPRWKRYGFVLPLAYVALAASIYAPAATDVMMSFNVSMTVAILPLSLYVVALGLGPVLAAPISETQGRQVVFLVSLPLGCLFTLGAGFSPTFAGLCILRFLAGMAFSPALAIGAGSICDVLFHEERAVGSALYVTCPFLGPALGPVIGSFVTVDKDWRWTQFTLCFFGVVAAILCIVFMQETYKKTILERRAKRRKQPLPPSPYATKGEALKVLFTIVLIRPLNMLFTEPIVGCLSLYVAFSFSTLFSFFAAFPYVFEGFYGFTVEQSGLVFLAVAVGCILAMFTTLICDRFIYMKKLAQNGGQPIAPEHRLYPALVGSFGLPIGLFWFGWSANVHDHWVSPVLAAIPFAWGNLCVFISAAMYLVDTYQAMNGASAMAANGFARYVLGAAFPLFTLQMYEHLGIGWATSLLGFIAVALMPIPWVLMKYGKKIRSKSSYETVDW